MDRLPEQTSPHGVPTDEDLVKVTNFVADLIKTYRVWRNLFVESEERVNFLNQADPRFFGFLQRCLWERLVLGVCRVLDPPETKTKRGKVYNLSIPFLKKSLRDPEKEQVQGLLGSIKTEHDRLKTRRDKIHAHNDRETMQDIQSLDPVFAADLEKTIRVIADCHSLIFSQIRDSEIDIFWQSRSAFELDLLELLYRGQVHKEAEVAEKQSLKGEDLFTFHASRHRPAEFIRQPRWEKPRKPQN